MMRWWCWPPALPLPPGCFRWCLHHHTNEASRSAAVLHQSAKINVHASQLPRLPDSQATDERTRCGRGRLIRVLGACAAACSARSEFPYETQLSDCRWHLGIRERHIRARQNPCNMRLRVMETHPGRHCLLPTPAATCAIRSASDVDKTYTFTDLIEKELTHDDWSCLLGAVPPSATAPLLIAPLASEPCVLLLSLMIRCSIEVIA